MSWKSSAILGLAVTLCAGAASAQTADPQSESIFHAIARFGGMATLPPQMPDFVRQSRPDKPGEYLPVYRPPEEPASTVKSKADLKAMDSDLQKIDEQHDVLRSAFPPSAQAVADRKAADAAKKGGAPKPAPSPSPAAN